MISPLLLQNCFPCIFNGRGNKELGRKHVNKRKKIIKLQKKINTKQTAAEFFFNKDA